MKWGMISFSDKSLICLWIVSLVIVIDVFVWLGVDLIEAIKERRKLSQGRQPTKEKLNLSNHNPGGNTQKEYIHNTIPIKWPSPDKFNNDPTQNDCYYRGSGKNKPANPRIIFYKYSPQNKNYDNKPSKDTPSKSFIAGGATRHVTKSTTRKT